MKTAIITGAGSGIGQAAALLLAREGFRLGLVGRRLTALEETAARLRQAGAECWTGALDVGDETAVNRFVSQAASQYGKLDLLVNCAGIFQMKSFENTSRELWDETLSANLTGAFIFSKAVWPYIEGGQIIHVSSVAGVEPYAGCAAYSASKYGLIGLSEVLALEGKKRSIRVHVVCPGNTETPIWGDQAPAQVRARMLRPEQVAEVIRWLAVSPPQVSFDPVVVRPSANPWDAR
jgi:NAD(P)-dependent dehydrogenase (short-subunit alcohol dehydrogenase family)